jgi:hypothetical protein
MKMGHEFELLERERDGASGPSNSSSGSVPIYKTYKRRWLGVVQIMLMNIIVSWDVSWRHGNEAWCLPDVAFALGLCCPKPVPLLAWSLREPDRGPE